MSPADHHAQRFTIPVPVPTAMTIVAVLTAPVPRDSRPTRAVAFVLHAPNVLLSAAVSSASSINTSTPRKVDMPMLKFLDGLAVFVILSIGLLYEIHRWKRCGSTAFNRPNRPAIVPWWVPWLGNAIQYGRNPTQFVEFCRQVT